MKILLAVDGSAYTKKMLAYLTTHEEMFGSNNDLTLFTVQLPLPARARAAVGADVANSYSAEEAEKVTAPVVKFLKRHGMEPKVVHKVGTAGEQIAKAAEAARIVEEAVAGRYEGPEMWLARPLIELQARWSVVPTRDTLVVESMRSREGRHLFVYPFAGRHVHMGLAALLACAGLVIGIALRLRRLAGD